MRARHVDRLYDLIAVDLNGNEVPSVEIEPQRASYSDRVARGARRRCAAGRARARRHAGAPDTASPRSRSTPGRHRQRRGRHISSHYENAPTSEIDVAGRTTDLEQRSASALPAGVTASVSDRVRVLLTIEEEIGSQTYSAGVTLTGDAPATATRLCPAGQRDVERTDRCAPGSKRCDARGDPDVSAPEPGSGAADLTVTPPGTNDTGGDRPGRRGGNGHAPTAAPTGAARSRTPSSDAPFRHGRDPRSCQRRPPSPARVRLGPGHCGAPGERRRQPAHRPGHASLGRHAGLGRRGGRHVARRRRSPPRGLPDTGTHPSDRHRRLPAGVMVSASTTRRATTAESGRRTGHEARRHPRGRARGGDRSRRRAGAGPTRTRTREIDATHLLINMSSIIWPSRARSRSTRTSWSIAPTGRRLMSPVQS